MSEPQQPPPCWLCQHIPSSFEEGSFWHFESDMHRLHNAPQLKERRRQLRSSLTPAEALLWKNLQHSQLDAKFRRQHSVGPYLLDFCCPACRLAVELDGQGHFDSWRSDYDVKRTQFLDQKRICILRFENKQIFESLDEVRATIQAHLKVPHTL